MGPGDLLKVAIYRIIDKCNKAISEATFSACKHHYHRCNYRYRCIQQGLPHLSRRHCRRIAIRCCTRRNRLIGLSFSSETEDSERTIVQTYKQAYLLSPFPIRYVLARKRNHSTKNSTDTGNLQTTHTNPRYSSLLHGERGKTESARSTPPTA